ncbi:hypothetical protein BSKO_12177 [Bryopsis sp. KO-2023]|nr:hypothetical protein BSKO_12177 [Bryopsis sp. KO-2023]
MEEEDLAPQMVDQRGLPETPDGGNEGWFAFGMESEAIIGDPEEIVAIIEAFGVVKLGEMKIHDHIVRKAFDGNSMLTVGCEKGEELDWASYWTDHLDKIRLNSSKSAAEAGWNEIITVEAHVMRIKRGAGPPGTGILQPVLVRWQHGKTPISVFGLPAVHAIINYKWERWAKKALLAEFILFLCWLGSYLTFLMSFRYEDLSSTCPHWREHIDSSELHDVGRLPTISLLCAVAFMSPFLIVELNTLYSYRLSWLTQFWNLIDMGTYALTLVALVVYLMSWGVCDVWFSILLGIQCILMVAKIQYFSRVFATSKGSFGDFLMVVIADVRWFLMFMFLTMIAFGMSFSIIYRHDKKLAEEDPQKFSLDPAFKNLWTSLVSMYCFMLGGFDVKLFYMGSNELVSVSFFLLFESVMAVMLLNLLIAIMTDSYSKVMEDEQLWILCSKAQIIDELETTLPKFITKRWNPSYVQILKVGPGKNVSLDSLWNRLDLAEGHLVGVTEEVLGKLQNFRVDALQKLQAISKAVDEFPH